MPRGRRESRRSPGGRGKVRRVIPPCGGRLVDLLVPEEAAAELKARATELPSIQLSERAMCDLEQLATSSTAPAPAQ